MANHNAMNICKFLKSACPDRPYVAEANFHIDVMMPPQQRKFELVPTTLAKSISYKPMTSKQIKKAYLKANRGPRISRAEQRRLDAKELERQKTEYEKECAAERVRVARERKAMKATKEKADRRAGLLKPSRHVRASQPMISLFVKSLQEKKRNRGSADGNKNEKGSGEPISDVMYDGGEVEQATKHLAVHVEMGTEPEPEPDSESEDEFGEFPELSQFDLLEKLDNSTSTPEPLSKMVYESSKLSRLPQPISISISPSTEEFLMDNSQAEVELEYTRLLLEAADAASKSDIVKPLIRPRSMERLPIEFMASPGLPKGSHSFRSKIEYQLGRRKAAAQSRIRCPTPRQSDLETCTKASAVPANDTLPTATQLFLESHIDDFLPSPTQEIRDLLNDIDDDCFPSNTQVLAEISPARWRAPHKEMEIEIEQTHAHPTVLPKGVQEREEDLGVFMCSQDFILSSQDVREIYTPIPVVGSGTDSTDLDSLSDCASTVSSVSQANFYPFIAAASRPTFCASPESQPPDTVKPAANADSTKTELGRETGIQMQTEAAAGVQDRFIQEREYDLFFQARATLCAAIPTPFPYCSTSRLSPSSHFSSLTPALTRTPGDHKTNIENETEKSPRPITSAGNVLLERERGERGPAGQRIETSFTRVPSPTTDYGSDEFDSLDWDAEVFALS